MANKYCGVGPRRSSWGVKKPTAPTAAPTAAPVTRPAHAATKGSAPAVHDA